MAASFAESRPEFTHHSEIVGTLAYLAPEQTGRTGPDGGSARRPVRAGGDAVRAGHGRPPFGFGDPLRLTHDHLARVPVSPAHVNPAVPAPLSEIVMRLLEKEPDKRYQSAEGLLTTWSGCETADGSAGARRPHRRARRSAAAAAAVASGRARDEVAALQAAFQDALAGQCRGVLVGGAPGVGKTALVDELRPMVSRAGTAGSCGQVRPVPPGPESDAVNQGAALGRLLLAEPEDELAELRQRI